MFSFWKKESKLHVPGEFSVYFSYSSDFIIKVLKNDLYKNSEVNKSQNIQKSKVTKCKEKVNKRHFSFLENKV